MKTKALSQFRAKLANDEPVYGLWITMESATVTEMAVALGIDWVVIDAEHGHLGWKEINEHLRASLRSTTVTLVRIAERSTSLTKRALDIGADGVVIPLVESADQFAQALQDARYPPEGRRGIGGERATAWGQCIAGHTAEANDNVLVVPIIESITAVPHVQSICHTSGCEVLFIGPADMSASAGYRGAWEGPGIAEQIGEVRKMARASGKQVGVLTTSHDDLIARREQGFRMLGLGTDTGLLLRSLHATLQVAGRDRTIATSLDPTDGAPVSR